MALFRSPGGKERLAKSVILPRLAQACRGRCREYREPFFGGGSVGLAMLRSQSGIQSIRMNDFDPGIACLWTGVIRWPELIIAHVRSFKPTVPAFFDLKTRLAALDRVPEAPEDVCETGFWKLAIHRISYSGLGTMAGGPLGGQDQINGGIASRWNPERHCKEVDEAHHLFSQVEVVGGCCTCRDFGEVIEDHEQRALLYCDPPYFVKGSQLYQHSLSREDHVRLAAVLMGSEHHWVLSYDGTPEIMGLYAWANLEAIEVGYSVNGCHRTKELLITPRRDAPVGVVGDEVGGSFGAAFSVAGLREAVSVEPVSR